MYVLRSTLQASLSHFIRSRNIIYVCFVQLFCSSYLWPRPRCALFFFYSHITSHFLCVFIDVRYIRFALMPFDQCRQRVSMRQCAQKESATIEWWMGYRIGGGKESKLNRRHTQFKYCSRMATSPSFHGCFLQCSSVFKKKWACEICWAGSHIFSFH